MGSYEVSYMNSSDKQQDTTVVNGEQPVPHKKNKWSLKKKITVIVGSIFAFIVIILLAVNTATSAPLKVSDEFINAIRSNNATAGYDLFSDEAQNATTAEDFESIVKETGPILSGEPKVQSKEIDSSTDNGTTAEIIYNIDGSDGIKYKVTVKLIEVSDQWKVQAYKSEAIK